MQAQAFLERHKPRLLEIADAAGQGIPDRTGARDFLDALHADFETVDDKPGRRPSLPGEDVFWWCVTILEELADLAPGVATKDPYVAMMLDQLRAIGRRLAAGEPLPAEFQLHWFDDDGDGAD